MERLTLYDTTDRNYDFSMEIPNLENGHYLYFLRIYVRGGCENGDYFCYKVGYVEISLGNTLHNRLKQINDNEFDCCCGVSPNNMILLALYKINGQSDERSFHRNYRESRLAVKKMSKSVSRECYEISYQNYCKFINYLRENFGNCKYKNISYAIDKHNDEYLDSEQLTDPRIDEEDNMSEMSSNTSEYSDTCSYVDADTDADV